MGLVLTVVERATQYPAICMVRKTHTGPLVDLGMDFEPENTGRMYLSVAVAKAIADKIGFVPREALIDAHGRVAELEAALAQAQSQLALAENFRNSVETTFAGAGFTRRRKKKEDPVGAN